MTKLKPPRPKPAPVNVDEMSAEEKLAHYSKEIRMGLARELGSMLGAQKLVDSFIAIIDIKIDAAIKQAKIDIESDIYDEIRKAKDDVYDRVNKRGEYDPAY